MPKITYVPKDFSAAHEQVIDWANEIISEYAEQGYSLTLRQLYYQLVARDLIPNKIQSYKRLGGIVADARNAGLIDWGAIEDRTRNLASLPHWDSPADILATVAHQFNVDLWARQEVRVEVWIEKEALSGIFESICDELDVPVFACRGYTSQSEVWAAGRRMRRHRGNGQDPVILHFGDHDPSGIDMTRDIIDRLELYAGGSIEVRRIALNFDQIEEFGPPPNPAKTTDSRFRGYVAEFGEESWELDALTPDTLLNLVRDEVNALIDADAWNDQAEAQEEGRRRLQALADDWED